MPRAHRIVIVLVLAALAGCEARRSGYPLEVAYPARPWQLGAYDGQIIETGSYRIYTTTSNDGLRRRIGGFLEGAHQEYLVMTGLVGQQGPDTPAEVYLLDDRRQWEYVTQRITGPLAETYLQIRQGGFSFAGKGIYWDDHPLVTYPVASHEGFHQFCHRWLDDNLPSWVEEGLATQMEGFVLDGERVIFRPESNAMRQGDLRESITAGRARSVERLIGMGAGDNLRESTWHGAEYYGQVWALLLMIRQDAQYNQGLQRMLADARAGRFQQELGLDDEAWRNACSSGSRYNQTIGPMVFGHYITDDLGGFQQRYRQFCREVTRLPR